MSKDSFDRELNNEFQGLSNSLNVIKDNIIAEGKIFYEINLDTIILKIENFFTELKLDYSSIELFGRKKQNLISENQAHTQDLDEGLKNEMNYLNKNIEENLDKITKFIKTVKNEIFLVIKKKVESLNKDLQPKLSSIEEEIKTLFATNINIIEEKINSINKSQLHQLNEFTEKSNKEAEKVDKEIENYVNILRGKAKEYEELKILYEYNKNKLNELQSLLDSNRDQTTAAEILVKELRHKLGEAENKLLECKAAVDDRENLLLKREECNNNLAKEGQALKNKILELQIQYDQLQKSHEEEKANLSLESIKKESDFNALKNELLDKNKKFEQVKNQLNEAKIELEKTNINNELSMNKEIEENTNLRNKIMVIDNEVQDLNKQMMALIREKEDLIAVLDLNSQKMEEVLSENNHLKSTINNLKNQINDIQNSLSETKAKLESKFNENNKAEEETIQEKDNSPQSNNQSENELHVIEKEQEACQARQKIEIMNNKISELENLLQREQSSSEEANNDLENYKIKFGEKQKIIEEQKEKIEELIIRINLINDQYNEVETARKSAYMILNEKENVLNDSLYMIEDLKKAEEESNIVVDNMNKKITELENDLKNCKVGMVSYEQYHDLLEKCRNFENLNTELKQSLDKSSQLEIDKNTKIKELNQLCGNLNDEKKQLADINQMLARTLKTYKLTFKQFFLMLLDDDIFIDLIQKTFSDDNAKDESILSLEKANNLEKNSQIFFENIYMLLKFVKPKIIFSFMKTNCNYLNNPAKHSKITAALKKKQEILGIQQIEPEEKPSIGTRFPYFPFLEKIKKLELENNLSININDNYKNKSKNNHGNIYYDSDNLPVFKRYEEFLKTNLSLEFLDKLDLEISDIDNEINGISQILSDLIIELEYNVEFYYSFLNKNNKIISELNFQLQSAKETLDESKKHESEKYEILNSNIQKLQQECRDYNKIEKSLKENLQTTENGLKELKSENEKLISKLKTLTNLYEDLVSERKTLIDKNINLAQQMENFKIENLEITEKNLTREALLKSLNEKVEILTKEKSDLLSQVSEMRKLSEKVQEKNAILENKEKEIEKMRTSYSELEEFIESLKIEKEQSLEVYKKQTYELNRELDNYREIMRIQEDKLNHEKKAKDEESEKRITDLELENKHLKEQKDKMKRYSEEILLKVKNDLKDAEYLVDKRMISNILIKYFDRTTDNKIKAALLETLANFMGFSNDERIQMGLYASYNNTSSAAIKINDKLKELSDDLYNFILNA